MQSCTPEYHLQATVYDTGGAERFRTLTAAYYRNANAAILIFDVEERQSFDSLQYWCKEMLENLVDTESVVWAVVGNKCDLTFDKEHDSILELCKRLGTELMFFTSAKTGENVQETLTAVIREVHKKSTTKKIYTY